jgi:hypothetical protein
MDELVLISARLPLQDIQELFDEAFESDSDSIDIMRIAVVGNDCGDGCEQANRGGNQGFRNTGRNCC